MTGEPILLESNQNHATVQTGGISTTLPAAMGEGGGYIPMVANTLAARYDGSPQPDKGIGANIVAAGFKAGNGAKAGNIGYSEECAPTLSAAESGTNQVPTVICGNPWDSQSERVYHGDGAWHSLNANESGGQSRDAILAFAQNQRDEVRDLGNVAGSLAAEPGMKQQTFVASVDFRNGTENTEVNGTLQAKESGGQSLNCNIVVRTESLS